jgi:hypothetical protein
VGVLVPVFLVGAAVVVRLRWSDGRRCRDEGEPKRDRLLWGSLFRGLFKVLATLWYQIHLNNVNHRVTDLEQPFLADVIWVFNPQFDLMR